MRVAIALAGALLVPSAAAAQDAVSSDLWRVAAGTLTVPAALAEEVAAPFWTPAVAIARGTPRFRIGAEAIHGPAEVGVNGGIATVAVRAGGVATVHFSYGRLGISDIAVTETSPEALGTTVPVWSQQVSLGLGGRLSEKLIGGVALRHLSGRTGTLSQDQLGLDFGASYLLVPRVRIAAATSFFDPLLSARESASGYSLGAEYRSSRFQLWDALADVSLRYGATLLHGEGPQQLASAALALGSLTLDLGLAREEVNSQSVWRSRFGIALRSGRYRVEIGRDGGVNAFGAAYRFGLSVVLE